MCRRCRQALFKAGAPAIWGKVLKGAARSSAFLAMYCTLCWRGACLGFQATGSCAPHVIAASAWPGAFRIDGNIAPIVVCMLQGLGIRTCMPGLPGHWLLRAARYRRQRLARCVQG